MDGLAALPLLVHALQEGHAPAAAGAGVQALAELRRHGGALAIEVVGQLPQADAVAQAHVVVGMHAAGGVAVLHHTQIWQIRCGSLSLPVRIPTVELTNFTSYCGCASSHSLMVWSM